MAVSHNLLWFLLAFALFSVVSAVVTYADYDIASDRVCSRLSKRELSVSMSRPLLVREGGRLLTKWSGVHSFSCTFEVEAKGRGIGVVAVIQKLKFRKLGSECSDYMQFKEDRESNRGPRLCGSMMFGHYLSANGSLPPPLPSPFPAVAPTMESMTLSILTNIFRPNFNLWSKVVSRGSVVDPKGELKTYLYVHNRPLRMDETLELVVAYSGYQECDGRVPHPGLFHCGYGLCISDHLVSDGVVNCPFGDCVDEISCTSAQASNLTAQILGRMTTRNGGGMSTGVTATSSFFGIAILVTIAACICFIMRRNKKRQETEGTTDGTVYPTQTGNGEYVGVPTNAGMQSMDQPPVPGQPMAGQQPPQGAAPIGFCVPQAGAPYPGAGAPYPGAGAPYPGAGAPYPGAGAPYPGAGAPYPGAGAPYPGAGAPYPAAGTPYPAAPAQYPPGNAPYPAQPSNVSAPSAPGTQESPPPYNMLFPEQKN